MKTSERWVEDTLLSLAANTQVRVCTVFLGLDVGFGRVDGPVLFETMVLGGIWDRNLYRYCTRQEALEGHAAIVSQLVAHDKRTMQTPALIRARNLANTTVQLAGRADMKAFVEQRANHVEP